MPVERETGDGLRFGQPERLLATDLEIVGDRQHDPLDGRIFPHGSLTLVIGAFE